MKLLFKLCFLILLPSLSWGDLAFTLSNLIGYTIIDRKTIIGWQNEQGNQGNDFQGCAYGKAIVFDDNKILKCAEYGYQYEFRPTAIILYNGLNFKMVVGDNIYNMTR